MSEPILPTYVEYKVALKTVLKHYTHCRLSPNQTGLIPIKEIQIHVHSNKSGCFFAWGSKQISLQEFGDASFIAKPHKDIKDFLFPLILFGIAVVYCYFLFP